MNTLEIDTIEKTSPLQTGAGGLCQKQITQTIKRTCTFGPCGKYVTDPDHRMGQHWVAIYIDANSRGEYYDPTGRLPFLRNARHFGTGTIRHQDSSAPGQFGTCVFFFDLKYKTSNYGNTIFLFANSKKINLFS